MTLYYFKAFHIVGAVAWFAGLFYLVRMFVYHVEADQKPEALREPFKEQFGLMEARVYQVICNPAMMLTWTCGLVMTFLNPAYWQMGWFHVKFALLLLLTAYHLWCKYTIGQLKQGKKPFTSFQFRLLNELPTLFLVSIVLLGVLQNMLNFFYAFGGVLAFGVLLVFFAKWYRKSRENAGE
ncbi:MAG: protoporphyrinogen oxidase HemJ [Runella slithyformis]|nr:MAG: protoporphyrinogen oxidase HemJ [Runella slithyformis]TAG76737.1 MAG: protoporphyrinogen oxidase HemJ [Cytophagales bacterium]